MNREMKRVGRGREMKVLLAVAGIFCFLFLFSSVQAMTIEELIDSYSFDYDGGEVEVLSVSDSMVSGVLVFDVEFAGVVSGSYGFYVDIADVNGLVTGEAVVGLNSSGGNVLVNISACYLSGASQFNYSLRIYDSEGSLVYRQGDFATGAYSYVGYEVLDVVDSDVGGDYVELVVSIDSGVVKKENVSVFLIYEDESFFVKSEADLVVGVNYVVLKIDGEILGASHYDGAYDIVGVLIGEKFVGLNLTSSVYYFRDYVEGSYFESYGFEFIDLDSNGLIDYLEFDFGVEVRQEGSYRVEAELYDSGGQYLASVDVNGDLDVGSEAVRGRVDRGLLYSLGANGPYTIGVARLFFGEDLIDVDYEVLIVNVSSYYDFERPPLSDLKIFMSGKDSEGDCLLDLIIKNSGEAEAFNVFAGLFDDSYYFERGFVDSLDVGEDYVFSFVSKGVECGALTAVVDFDNLVEEENEDNNVVSYKDAIFNLSGDERIAFESCLEYFGGSAWSSMSRIRVVNYFEDFYFDKGRTWYTGNFLLGGDVRLTGNASNKLKEEKIMDCYFNLDSLILPGESFEIVSDSAKQAWINSEESESGALKTLRERYEFELSDGMRVDGNGKYDADGNKSSIKIKCVNRYAEEVCESECENGEIHRERVCRDDYLDDSGCEGIRTVCLEDCDVLKGKEKKDCAKVCDEDAEGCGSAALDGYRNCVEGAGEVNRFCREGCDEVYDVSNSYEFDGMVSLSVYDVLGECGYLG